MSSQTQGDATVVIPGGSQADATVVSTGVGTATVVVSSMPGDGTVVAPRLATLDLASFQPRVEYQLRAHNTYALAGQTTQNYILADIRAYFAGGLSARAPIPLAIALARTGHVQCRPIH